MPERFSFGVKFDYWGTYPPKPIVPVRIIGNKGLFIDTYAMIDTGADCSLFDARWAAKLGIKYDSVKPIRVRGVGKGALWAYEHDLSIIVSDNPTRQSPRAHCKIGFASGLGIGPEEQLLGRYDVFDEMRFAFRQYVEEFYVGYLP